MDTFDEVYLHTAAMYTDLLEFVARIDLPTRIALIALLLSVVLNVYTATRLYNLGVRDMGKKQRKRENNKVIGDRVCDLLEDLRAKDVITNEELRRYYTTLSRALRIPDLRWSRAQPPWEPDLKDRLVTREMERVADRAVNGSGTKLPDPAPKERKFTLSLKGGAEKTKRKFIFRPRSQA